MSPANPQSQEAALPFRVYGLEGQIKTQDAAIAKLQENDVRRSEALLAQAVTLARHDEQLGNTQGEVIEIKTDVAALAVSVGALAEKMAASTGALAEKVATSSNRIAWTFVGFAFTLAASAIAVLVFGPPPGS